MTYNQAAADAELTYRIVRFFQEHPREVIEKGLTREEAEAHCNSPETSSRTATSQVGLRLTRKMGGWFDGFEKEFSFQADFTPEAWLNDNAIAIDPQGDTVWDVTDAVYREPVYWARVLDQSPDDWDYGLIDNDDTLKADSNAPEWVRNWSGPFTIRVTRADA